MLMKFLQRPAHSLLRRVITHAEREADGVEIVVLEKAEQQGIAVFVAQVVHRFIENRADAIPVRRGFGVGKELFHGLSFVREAAAVVAQLVEAAKRVLRYSQPTRDALSTSLSASGRALRARSVKTLWATSQARSDEFTHRNAAEYTRSVWRVTISRTRVRLRVRRNRAAIGRRTVPGISPLNNQGRRIRQSFLGDLISPAHSSATTSRRRLCGRVCENAEKTALRQVRLRQLPELQ